MQALLIKFKAYLLLFTLILLLVHFSIWWVIDYEFTDLPEYIYPPYLKLYGVLLGGCTLIVLTIFQKLLLKKHSAVNVLQLTVLSTLVVFVSTVIYSIAEPFLPNNASGFDWDWFIKRILVLTLTFGMFALSIALQLKKKPAVWQQLITAAMVGLFIILNYYTNLFR